MVSSSEHATRGAPGSKPGSVKRAQRKRDFSAATCASQSRRVSGQPCSMTIVVEPSPSTRTSTPPMRKVESRSAPGSRASSRLVREPDVDGRERLRLGHLEQMLARELEQRDERDDDDRRAAGGVEEV